MPDNRQKELEDMARRFNASPERVEAVLEAKRATNMREKLKGFDKERTLLLQGDPEAIRTQHEKGRLTARERVNKLFDAGSFEELGVWQRNGVIAGYGEVNKRPVTVWAQDVTEGTTGFAKIHTAMERAVAARTPLIGIFDSPGVNAQHAIQYPDFFSAARMARSLTEASGAMPTISLVLGECSGGLSIAAGLADFLFMVRNTSYMHLAPPLPGMTSQELGDPWDVHAKVTGCCSVLVENDEDCLEKCRQLLSFLPSHNMEMPPVVDTGDDPNRREEELMEFIPVDNSKPYSMYRALSLIVDNGEFFEIRHYWTRNLITGFARLDGHTVGIIANNPQDKGGCLNLDAADKMSRHVRFCDAFDIPIIWVSDNPAFLPAVDEETRGLIRHGAGCIMANSETTVPMITIVLRKQYGGGGLAMGLTRDLMIAWPPFESATMNPEAATLIRYKRELEAITDEAEREEQKKRRMQEVEWGADMDRRMGVSNFIDPRDSRRYLIGVLKWLRNKKVEWAPRKHENIRI
ncbi:acyl-CoA carboxylase subunit beta [Chloroflexota bacterium]